MSIQTLLKQFSSLDQNIKIYIPSTTEGNKPADTQRYVTQALTLFGSLFGGATSYDAQGSWLSDRHGLIIEHVTIVESYASRSHIRHGIQSVLSYAKMMKNELKQEAVSVEYNNKLYFI